MTNKNTKIFIDMHREAVNVKNGLGKLDKRTDGIGETLAKIYRSGTKNAEYLEWLTASKYNGSVNKQSLKAIQNNVNKSATQKMMLSCGDKEKPTQKVRLMRANKPLMNKGLCTQMQIDEEQYMFITEKVDVVVKTFESDFQKMVNAWKVSADDIQKIIKSTKFA